MIKKAETTRTSVVLENEMLETIEKIAKGLNMNTSETIRMLLTLAIKSLQEAWSNWDYSQNMCLAKN